MVNRAMDSRLRKLESVAHPTGPARCFRVIIDGNSDREAEIARFKAENGVTDEDSLIVRLIVPFQQRANETAAEAYEREMKA